MLDGFQRTDAAADLDRQVRVASGDGRDHITVDRLTFERTVQIDQMQTTAATLDPLGGHGHRIIGEHRGIFHPALTQTDASAVLEIDSGIISMLIPWSERAASCKRLAASMRTH